MAFSVLLMAACTGDDEPTFDDLMDGVPVDPSEYEITPVNCVKLEDRIELQAKVTNTSGRLQAYRVRYSVTNTAGEVLDIIHEGDSAAAGETIDLTSWFGNPDQYDADPDCSIDILISAFDALD